MRIQKRYRHLNAGLPTVLASLAVLAIGCGTSSGTHGTEQSSVTVSGTAANSADRQQLSGHLTEAMKRAPVVGRVPGETNLTLTLGLPVANRTELEATAKAVSDPSSPSYRSYLTPEQFGDRFGASPADYQRVLDWAKSKNLNVTTHKNRLVAEISGAVRDLEAALNVHFNYATRPDGTQFHVVDAEPSLDLNVPVEHITNLEDFSQPKPTVTYGGSGEQGSRTGYDFRHAYAPGTSLTGTGQSVGIMMWTGFAQNDINGYLANTGIKAAFPNVQIVTADGNPGTDAGGELENTLDVEMAISMAPGAQIVAFTCAWADVAAALGNMADDPSVKQLSASYWDTGFISPTTSALLFQLATQGQSFFIGSMDNGAYYPGNLDPNMGVEAPYTTVVGGTWIEMADAGSTWVNEFACCGGGGVVNPSVNGGSAGDPIPWYQVGLTSETTSPVSAVYRNLPDVSAEGSAVQVYYGGGIYPNPVSGTSVATPLWAGFMALVNEQAANDGLSSVGFANPALYSIGATSEYSTAFHDIISGSNPCVSNGGPCATPNPSFNATTGYDLATGLGTPDVGLISALASWSTPAQATAKTYGWSEFGFGTSGLVSEEIVPNGSVIDVAVGSQLGQFWKSGAPDDTFQAFADFDGDGSDDVLVTSAWGIGILKRLSSTQYQTVYLAPYGTVLGSWHYAGDPIVAVGDFDGNGKADILVQSAWGFGILSLNTSNELVSTWLAPYGTTIGSLQLEPSMTVLGNKVYRGSNGDFDGDGRVDILVRGASGIGLLQQTPAEAVYSNYYSPFGTSTASSDLGGWEFASTDTVGFVGDFHTAKKAEVVIRSGWGMGTLGVSTNGGFTATSMHSWGTALGAGWTIASSDTIQSVADYNGDGLSDLLVRSATGSDGILFSAGTSSISAGAGARLSGGWAIGTGDVLQGAVGDLDGNGTEDIFVQSAWGVGVLSVSGGSIVTKTLASYGSALGSWPLESTDVFYGSGRLDSAGQSHLVLANPIPANACTPELEAAACEDYCGTTAPNGCGGTVTCRSVALTGAACCAALGTTCITGTSGSTCACAVQ